METLIIDIILILFFSKLLGALSERLGSVELLGCIITGLVLGPVLHLVNPESIEALAKIGLILIIFFASFFEFDIKKFEHERKGILWTGIIGGVLPFILGSMTGLLFKLPLITSLFLGAVLAATSVSISVGTMISLNKINTKVGRYILTSSIIDDIVGILILVILLGLAVNGTFNVLNLAMVVLKIVLFAATFLLLLFLIPKTFSFLKKMHTEEIQISMAIVVVLLLSVISETLGLSSVIGAFLAGILLSKVSFLKERVSLEKFKTLGFGFFIPFFFTFVGLNVKLNLSLVSVFSIIFVLIAILSKVLAAIISGCIAKMRFKEKIALGIGRMARGEVALTVIAIGSKLGFVSDQLFGATFMLILLTTILTPLLLKPLLKRID
ncbi:cation:proton antiporter [Candidatus Woesearchaeota archaeon]|nr:cation:proton antiporter [Candidatus Woesearchaeota archaeon]